MHTHFLKGICQLYEEFLVFKLGQVWPILFALLFTLCHHKSCAQYNNMYRYSNYADCKQYIWPHFKRVQIQPKHFYYILTTSKKEENSLFAPFALPHKSSVLMQKGEHFLAIKKLLF